MSHAEKYLVDARKILTMIDPLVIDRMIEILVEIREKRGRLFFLGVGGGAGHCSHAVNDFRKIAGFEAYTPLDNVSELTARTNDNGWDSVFVDWLANSRLGPEDGIFVLSVGGGNETEKISNNLILAMDEALKRKSKILAIVGRDGGYAARVADVCMVIPNVNKDMVTAHTESFQALLLHLIVSDPRMIRSPAKWESIR